MKLKVRNLLSFSFSHKPVVYAIFALLILGVFFSTFVFTPSVKNAKAAGTTYYVSKAGNDTTGNGSSGNPWLTLQKAHGSSADGDTIHIGAGTYAEAGSGSSWRITKGQTWIADDAVIVHGSGAGAYASIISGTSQANFYNITFDGETRTGGGIQIAASSGNKYFSNCTFMNGATQTAIVNDGSDNVLFENSFFSGTTQFLIKIGDAQVTLTNPTLNITSCTYGIFLFSTTSTKTFLISGGSANISAIDIIISTGNYNITLDGMNMTLNSGAPSVSSVFAATQSGKSGNIVINNNIITNNALTSNSLFNINGASSYNVTIEGNTINQNVVTFDKTIIGIQNQANIIIRKNTLNDLSTSTASAVLVTSSGQDIVSPLVQNNTVHTRSLTGKVISFGSEGTTANDNKITGIVAEDNKIYGPIYYDETAAPSLHSIFVGFNKQATVRRNLVIGGGYGVVIKGGVDTAYDHIGGVYNNIFANNKVEAVYAKGVTGVDFYNNTLYAKENIDQSSSLIYLQANPDNNNPASGCRIKNNIVYGRDGYALVAMDEGSRTGLDIDSNLYWNNTGTNFQWNAGAGTYTTLAAWQALGYDTHSSVGNPSFTNTATFDFHLQSTSLAIDAGIDLNINTDYAGKQHYDDPAVANTGSVGAFSKNYVDIGAYEYVTPPNPVLQSVACPSQSSSCSNTSPDISVITTSSTTSYNYLIDQTLSPLKASVQAGTVDADGSFSVPTLTTPGTYYIHVIAKNLDGDFAANYGTYAINYASTPVPTTLSTPVAKFPETGIPPSHNNIPRNIVMLSGVIALISVSLVVFLRKRRRIV